MKAQSLKSHTDGGNNTNNIKPSVNINGSKNISSSFGYLIGPDNANNGLNSLSLTAPQKQSCCNNNAKSFPRPVNATTYAQTANLQNNMQQQVVPQKYLSVAESANYIQQQNIGLTSPRNNSF